MARDRTHVETFERLYCLHQLRAGQKPACSPIQESPAHQAVGEATGRLIGAECEAKRAAASNNPAKLGQSQMGIRYGFQCPNTRHKIERAVFKRQGLQSSLYPWNGNVGTAREHGRRRVEKGHRIW